MRVGKEDVYIYRRPLPLGINEVVFPCADGWTVWIADRLDREQAQEAYKHAVAHVQRGDFNKSDVGMIEIGVRLDDHANIHI